MTQLILVPALACTAALYADVLPLLPKSLKPRVHIPDAERYSLMVKNLLAEADERFLIVGTSMGARLALEVTLAAPERVLGTVMIGAAAGAVADQAAGLRRSARIRRGEFDAVMTDMAAIISHLPGPRGVHTRDAFIAMGHGLGPAITARQSDALAHREDLWPALKAIATPMLCLWGMHDQFSPAEDGLRVAGAVQHGTFVALPDCGHFPTLEYPQQTADAISSWYRQSFI